ncbi:hypothetical protein AB0M95_08645 [Sphaerisporangium sp. NPDC051017]|uniref:hypothetical protein n=1 Tax=unclassified Sphaerisporangium TaxID=2630420 RepID=UPI0033D14037
MSSEQHEKSQDRDEHLSQRIERLEEEVGELREANEILQSIASFFAPRDGGAANCRKTD